MENVQEIITNLKLLHSHVQLQPETRFDLQRFKKEKECGTCFCTAGLAACIPEFQSMGLQIYEQDEMFYVSFNGVDVWESSGIEKVFGQECFGNLFEIRDAGYLDEQHLKWNGDMWELDESITDKQLALWRLERQIEIYEGKLLK